MVLLWKIHFLYISLVLMDGVIGYQQRNDIFRDRYQRYNSRTKLHKSPSYYDRIMRLAPYKRDVDTKPRKSLSIEDIASTLAKINQLYSDRTKEENELYPNDYEDDTLEKDNNLDYNKIGNIDTYPNYNEYPDYESDFSPGIELDQSKSDDQETNDNFEMNNIEKLSNIKHARLDEFRYNVGLDSKGDFNLLWDIDPITEVISFKLRAKVKKADFLAFGFSDYGEVKNADLVVMWTNTKGKHTFQDAHTDEEGRLHVDKQQDYTLDDVTVQDGYLNLVFHRKFDTCDDNDYTVDSGTTHILLVIDPGVKFTLEGLDIKGYELHMERAQLIKSQLPDPPMPDDVIEFVMHVDNVEIPAVETTYWYAIRKLPEMLEKHHIIKFEGAVSPSGEGLVHHMEVFHCVLQPGEKIPAFNGPSPSKSGRPKGLEPCHQVIGAWAMGAQPLSYPEEAGLPIGGPGFSRYVMLEVHYNNPDLKKGVIDSSGIKFHVTKKLRKHDAGTMEIGLEYTDKMALPPGLPVWKLKGYCIAQCTKMGLPDEGIKVFASQLHTHLTGRRTYTKHYRRGIELPDLNRDNHYSQHYQEIRKLPRPVTVLPGDSLVHVCEDSTADRTNVTLGGFAISDEMCVNYMHYYPRVDLEVCKSSVTTSSLYGFFKFLNDYNHQFTSPDLGVSDNYKAIDWSPMNIHLLKNFYEMAPMSMQCNQSDGNRFPGEWEDRPIPEILFPRPAEERLCLL